MEKIEVHIIFTIDREGYPAFTDALIYPIAVYQGLSAADIDAAQEVRYKNYTNDIDAASQGGQ